MSSFVQTINPTPFSYFDAEPAFQSAADSVKTWVLRKLGADILSVELTSKQIWACFEEATLEYARHVYELKIKSELVTVLGMPTGSDLTNKYPLPNLEYLMRLSDAYATYAQVGGSYDAKMGYVDLTVGKQDYNIYSDLKDETGSSLFTNLPSGSQGKMRISEVFHFEPSAAQRTLINASNITNFLATNFNYESYVNSTVFYVLPVFEDVLRRGMLETAARVRRSHYSWELIGTNMRLYPIPMGGSLMPNKVWIRVMSRPDPLNASFVSGSINGGDTSISGVSGPHNVPYNVIPYTSITEPGRQWIRQYTLALAREVLGLIRSKFSTVPIPNADLTLNGDALVSQAREDKDKLVTQLREFLDQLTNEKLMEQQANLADHIHRQLKYIPMPAGKSVFIG